MQLLPLAVALTTLRSASANTVQVTETRYATVYATATVNANTVTFTGPTTFVTKLVFPSSSSSTSLVVPTTSILKASTSSVSTAAPKRTTTLSKVATVKTLAPSTTLSSVKTSSSVKTTTSSTSSSTPPISTALTGVYADIAKSPGLDAKFAKDTLDAHNADRALHSAPDLSWNKTLYEYAQAYADKHVCGGDIPHSGGPYGENIAAGFSDGVTSTACWYGEGSTYDYATSNTYNHFSQVVWKATTQLGCGIKDCRAENWGQYVICSYDPRGNMVTEEAENVFPH